MRGRSCALIVIAGCGAGSHEPDARTAPTGDAPAPADARVDAADRPDAGGSVRYVIAGDHGQRVRVARLYDDGTLDRAYGTDGWTAVDTASSAASPGALDSAGRLLVPALDADGLHASLLRFTPAGALDPTFSVDGQAVMLARAFVPPAIAVRPGDGAALVTNGPQNVRVYGLISSGELDPTFGTSGVTVIDDLTVSAATSTSDGMVIGVGQDRATLQLTVFRLTATGALDPTFGSNGRVVVLVYPDSLSGALAAASRDGRVIVAGYGGFQQTQALVALRPDGSLDPTFAGGVVGFDPDQPGVWSAVAIDADGRVVVAGRFYDAATATPRVAIARYLTSGELDPSFGNGKGYTLALAGFDLAVADLRIEPQGRIVVLAWDGVAASLIRLLPDGSVDPSFGFGGAVVDGTIRSAGTLLRVETTP